MEKPKKKINLIPHAIKITGATGLIGLVTFLSNIFCTNESFSNWKELQYYPTNKAQNEKIAVLETISVFNKNTLIRIERKQEKILDILMKKGNH